MVFSCKSRSLLLLKHFWVAVTPSVTWRSIAQRLRAYLWRPSLDFVYSCFTLVCPRASGGHALITRSLRKTQEINRRGCYALLSQMIICGRSLHKIGGGICISADYFNCLMFLCFFFFFSCVGMRMLLYTTLF